MTTWTIDEIRGWFAGRLPDEWFDGPPELSFDRDELLVVGVLPTPEVVGDGGAELAAAGAGRIPGLREGKVSWGVRCGERTELFTTQSVPVMTRLRMPERAVLDTLLDAGVARSRSEALAWCVRLVGRHEKDWIDQLREAMATVEAVRAEGPTLE